MYYIDGIIFCWNPFIRFKLSPLFQKYHSTYWWYYILLKPLHSFLAIAIISALSSHIRRPQFSPLEEQRWWRSWIRPFTSSIVRRWFGSTHRIPMFHVMWVLIFIWLLCCASPALIHCLTLHSLIRAVMSSNTFYLNIQLLSPSDMFC